MPAEWEGEPSPLRADRLRVPVLVLEVTEPARPLRYGPQAPLPLGVVFVLLATDGFAWARRGGWPRRRARAVLGTAGDAGHERADGMLAKAQRQAEEALDEVRRSVAALREPRASKPLQEVLAALAAETSAAAVPTELEIAGAARSLPAEAEEALYRAAQEGLTNIRKHADATRARLLLDYRHTEAVRLEVHDDGTGMAEDRDLDGPPGFGLLGLQERASRLGGRLLVDTAPGRGVTLRMEVPG